MIGALVALMTLCPAPQDPPPAPGRPLRAPARPGAVADRTDREETDSTAAEVLRGAAGACRDTTSVRYHGTWRVLADPAEESEVVHAAEGDAEIVRAEDDEFLPARIRLALDDRTIVYADGEERSVIPALARVNVRRSGAAAVVAGGLWFTPLVEHSFVPGRRYSRNPERRLEIEEILELGEDHALVGVDVVDGVRCRLVSFTKPDDDRVEGRRGRVWIGIEDELPRRFEVTGRAARTQVPLAETFEIRGLEVDPDVPDGRFTLPVPPGFERILSEREPPSRCAEAVDVGHEAPPFSLSTAAGRTVSLADLRGRVVLLDFWGTWCAPCLQAIPMLEEIREEHRDEAFDVLAISCREPDGADPSGVLERHGGTYTVLLEGDDVAAAYGVGGFPTTIVVGRDGTVLYRHVGLDSELFAEVRSILRDELGGR